MNTPNKQRRKAKKPKGFESTYNDLILTAAGIIKVQTELPVVYEVGRFLFDRWIRNNNKTITEYWKLRAEIDYKHYVHKIVDGNPVYEYDNELPVLKEGMTRESHKKEYDELNAQIIIMIP